MKSNSVIKKMTKSRELSLIIVMIALCAVASIFNPSFVSLTNIAQIFMNNALTIVMSAGMLCVLLTGGIDISIASILGFSGMTVGVLLKYDILDNTFLLFVISCAIGIVCGLLNGLLISKGNVSPIISTLGFMYIWRGFAYVISDNKWASGSDVAGFSDFGTDGSPGPYIIIAVVFVAGFILLKWTKFGRKIYAVGSNREAARVSGINVDAVLIYTYVIMGFLAGLCGALSVAIYASAQPNMQYGLEMDVIASCVIGGVSMSGGRGSIVGTFIGALILALITRALPLVGIDSIAQNMVKGILILAVVVLNVVTQRIMDKANLERRVM